MPRSRRITLTGKLHLVVSYAIGQDRLFFDERDYEAYLHALRQMVRDRVIKLHAFCLAPSEVRLVLTPLRMPLARIMQRLHGSHTQRINQRQKRRGYLFSGRFFSQMFQPEDLISVVRNVHLWPVRVGIARRIETYPWSSHSAYVFFSDPWRDLVDSEPLLVQFSANLPIAQKAFARYVESVALEEDDYGVTQPILSAEGEPPKPKRRLSLTGLAKRVALLLNVNVALLKGPSRRQDLVMARRLLATVAVVSAQRTVSEVSAFLRRDKAQISRLVSQGMDLLDADEPFRALLDSLRGRGLALPMLDAALKRMI